MEVNRSVFCFGKYPAEGSQFPEVNIRRPYLGYPSLELTESVFGLRCNTNVHNHTTSEVYHIGITTNNTS
ncbi:hypothetical protein NPIL_138141 [Nephila pilipes]|uniref:Uncharacterized protein n=1 Tax=Nephila pilipes TaxID=299642 RepID=A0A8X6TTR2_NEPPI|nr:hypothetical protein NPIL_138141 [Nephila pilipes]